MTLDQFLNDLAAVDRTWSLVDGNITSDYDLCPIHEVWLASEYENESLDDYFEEGVRLGLQKRTVAKSLPQPTIAATRRCGGGC